MNFKVSSTCFQLFFPQSSQRKKCPNTRFSLVSYFLEILNTGRNKSLTSKTWQFLNKLEFSNFSTYEGDNDSLPQWKGQSYICVFSENTEHIKHNRFLVPKFYTQINTFSQSIRFTKGAIVELQSLTQILTKKITPVFFIDLWNN